MEFSIDKCQGMHSGGENEFCMHLTGFPISCIGCARKGTWASLWTAHGALCSMRMLGFLRNGMESDTENITTPSSTATVALHPDTGCRTGHPNQRLDCRTRWAFRERSRAGRLKVKKGLKRLGLLTLERRQISGAVEKCTKTSAPELLPQQTSVGSPGLHWCILGYKRTPGLLSPPQPVNDGRSVDNEIRVHVSDYTVHTIVTVSVTLLQLLRNWFSWRFPLFCREPEHLGYRGVRTAGPSE